MVLQIIAVVALMTQSYIFTEDDSKRLNVDCEISKYLVTVLGCAMRGRGCGGIGFHVIEVIQVR